MEGIVPQLGGKALVHSEMVSQKNGLLAKTRQNVPGLFCSLLVQSRAIADKAASKGLDLLPNERLSSTGMSLEGAKSAPTESVAG